MESVQLERGTAQRMARATLAVENQPFGYRLTRRNRKHLSENAGDTYEGPFKVINKDASTVTIKAYDGSQYYAHNYIIAGLSRIESTSDVDVTITATGSVYAKIVYSAGSYVVTYHNAASLPAQADGEYYVELAAVDFTDSKASVKQQIQYGNINISGRVV